MAQQNPPTAAPTTAELLNDPVILQAMEDAWNDSEVGDAAQRHEEGGWIYMDTATGQISVRRAPRGGKRRMSIGNPPVVPGSVVVGTFHTHPNPTAAGWKP